MIAVLSESGAQENHLIFPRGESCFKTLAKPIQPTDWQGLGLFGLMAPSPLPGNTLYKRF
ncbi:hypothetical protein HYALB_00009813, partial [Hymenoscyphus albidus]